MVDDQGSGNRHPLTLTPEFARFVAHPIAQADSPHGLFGPHQPFVPADIGIDQRKLDVLEPGGAGSRLKV